MNVGRIFRPKSTTDTILAAGLLLLIVWLFFNGSYASPREQQYDVAVENLNKQVMDRVIFSQQWWADDNLNKADVNTNLASLPFTVAKTPREAINFVKSHDASAEKAISQYFLNYENWLKKNRYTPKEVAKYKMQPYKLTKLQQRDAQEKLDSIRSSYMAKIQKKVDDLVAEQESVAEDRAASSRAIVSANESAAIAAKESALLAAENARISSSVASSLQQSSSTSGITKPSGNEEASNSTSITSMSSSAMDANSTSSIINDNDSELDENSQTQPSTVQ